MTTATKILLALLGGAGLTTALFLVLIAFAHRCVLPYFLSVGCSPVSAYMPRGRWESVAARRMTHTPHGAREPFPKPRKLYVMLSLKRKVYSSIR